MSSILTFGTSILVDEPVDLPWPCRCRVELAQNPSFLPLFGGWDASKWELESGDPIAARHVYLPSSVGDSTTRDRFYPPAARGVYGPILEYLRPTSFVGGQTRLRDIA